MKTIIEPFKIKTVEPIRLTTPEERELLIRQAGYNVAFLRAEDVIIDLLTDSGTGAMSAEGWAALMRGDESYAGAKSWYVFENTVQEIFGFQHVIPTHQGRAAERLLCNTLVKPGMIVPSNTHFDTGRANIQFVGGLTPDFPSLEASDLSSEASFKGNMNLDKLEKLIEEVGVEKIPYIILTATDNSGGGQPVSMANIREVSKLAHYHNIPLYIDACRFAENAYFIKQREEGYSQMSIKKIVSEMFSYADGCIMSAKKDGFANIGGFLCTRDGELAKQLKNLCILTEGFPTYGGLAGRDLEAIAVGLREVLDEDYLSYRIKTNAHLIDQLVKNGVPMLLPAGGHAIFIDARKFLPHIPPLQYPALSIVVELYIEAGIRSGEIGTVFFGKNEGGVEKPGKYDLVRLAIPRRVYTQNHLNYVVEAITNVWERRNTFRGMKIIEEAPFLRHFTARFDYL
ncbi:MAG: tryptophanase [Rivularia sp. (in: cyanobacteria)]